jgi:hypothetical protein
MELRQSQVVQEVQEVQIALSALAVVQVQYPLDIAPAPAQPIRIKAKAMITQFTTYSRKTRLPLSCADNRAPARAAHQGRTSMEVCFLNLRGHGGATKGQDNGYRPPPMLDTF